MKILPLAPEPFAPVPDRDMLPSERPFTYLQVYCDAVIDDDPDLTVEVMLAVRGRMLGEPLPWDAADRT